LVVGERKSATIVEKVWCEGESTSGFFFARFVTSPQLS